MGYELWLSGLTPREYEVYRLLIDKGALALVLAIAGLIGAFLLERYKSIVTRRNEILREGRDRARANEEAERQRSEEAAREERDRSLVPRTQLDIVCRFFAAGEGRTILAIHLIVENKGKTIRGFKSMRYRVFALFRRRRTRHISGERRHQPARAARPTRRRADQGELHVQHRTGHSPGLPAHHAGASRDEVRQHQSGRGERRLGTGRLTMARRGAVHAGAPGKGRGDVDDVRRLNLPARLLLVALCYRDGQACNGSWRRAVRTWEKGLFGVSS